MRVTGALLTLVLLAPGASAAPAQADPEPSALVRQIEPVRRSPDDLARAWQDRREALREQDLARAQAAEQRLLDIRKELALENLDDLATAEVRASRRALAANAPADAVARAELAVALAPDLAAAHLALARARLARDPGQPRAALASVADGIDAAFRSPPTARALVAQVLVAGLLALALTAGISALLLLLRRVRLLLHDARHLPVLRHGTAVQAGIAALVVLTLPLALRLGPATLLAVIALATGLYLRRAERAVMTAALVVVALLPAAVEQAARLTAWDGTLAADVHELEHGAGAPAAVARLEARAARGELPIPGLLALGRYHRRLGHLPLALRHYQAAAGRPEALVGIGNVRLLDGDVDGAKAAYLAAVDAAAATGQMSAMAAAHYDVSKVYLRQAALDQAQKARDRAASEDPALVARYGSDDDFRANRWVIDVPVPAAEVAALATDGLARDTADAVRLALGGPLPAFAWPWALLLVAAGLWAMAPLAYRASPSRTCDRCGRPACSHCDGVAGTLCGQCVNVFLKRAVVDPRDRADKERQVERHARVRRRVPRALAVLLSGAGHLWHGDAAHGALALLAAAFLVAIAATWDRIVPLHQPPGWLAAAPLVVALPAAALVWALAARDLFRRTER